MTREQKIEFLQGVATGTRKVDELVKDEFQVDYEKCTCEQLEAIIVIGKKVGGNIYTIDTPGLSAEDIVTLKLIPLKNGSNIGDNRLPNFDHLTPDEVDRILKIAES